MQGNPIREQVEQLIEGLSSQKRFYQEMIVLAKQQNELLQRESTDRLMNVMADKQAIVKKLEAIEADISPVKKQWRIFRQKLDPAQRDRVQGVMDGVRDVLEALLAIENEVEEKMRRQRDAVKSRMRHVHTGKKVTDAYRKQKRSGGILDSQS